MKENKQCWRKHVNFVCLLFKNDLNHLFNSPYDETQQCTHSLVIKHINKLSSLYCGIYKYGTVHANFNIIKVRYNSQVSNSVHEYNFDIEKSMRYQKINYNNYYTKYSDESVDSNKNDMHFEIITSCTIIRTALHRLRQHYSVINDLLASFDDYCTLDEESRSYASEIFIPIDCTDTSTSQLTTSSMPITVLLEDTVCQLLSENAVVFEDSQQKIFDHTEVAITTAYPNDC